MSENWKYITPPTLSFAGLPVCTQLDKLEADIAIIGLHYVSPYPQRSQAATSGTGAETAADAIRRQSARFIDHLDHYDFDFNDLLLAGRQVRLVDCGDVDRQPAGGGPNPENITAAIRAILNRGAIPIALGTDEGGVIPVLRAFDAYADFCVVHFDAHIDWRDERDGVREGGLKVWLKSVCGVSAVRASRRSTMPDHSEASLFAPVKYTGRESMPVSKESRRQNII
jgi:agmatinase